MNKIFFDFSFFFIKGFLAKKALTCVKTKALLAYLKTLQALRKSLVGGVIFAVVLQLMIIGLIGSVVTGVLLLPDELPAKLLILLIIFATLFVVPLILLCILLSGRLWLKLSGAQQMLADLAKDNG